MAAELSPVLLRAFHAAPIALAVVDEFGVILIANARFLKACDLKKQSLGQRPLAELFRALSVPLPTRWAVAWDGEVSMRADPEADAWHAYVSPLEDEQAASVLALVPSRETDVEGVMRSQRLEQLGTLAGGVAHDMNNVLTGVLGHVSYLRLACGDDAEISDSLLAIEDGARRAAGMTQQILKFAKANESASEAVNICDVVSAGIQLLKSALSKRIQLKVYGDSRPLWVHGDEGRLSQVFMNLIVNARDALPKGGVIEITLSQVVLDGEFCELYPALTPGEFVRLIIKDDGVGMPPDVQANIFEPFYTTKEKDGTGLGLATVATIIREFGGLIECTSTVGQGTRFDIFLRAARQHDTEQAPSNDPVQLPGGSERLLVVDDEEVVRTVMQRSLEHLGYQVDVAVDGPDALSKFRHDRHAYGLVILDMMMPKMAGDEVFRRMRELAPQVRVLLASGYTSEGRAQSVLTSGGLGFIQKPFAVEELAREVRRCLDIELE